MSIICFSDDGTAALLSAPDGQPTISDVSSLGAPSQPTDVGSVFTARKRKQRVNSADFHRRVAYTLTTGSGLLGNRITATDCGTGKTLWQKQSFIHELQVRQIAYCPANELLLCVSGIPHGSPYTKSVLALNAHDGSSARFNNAAIKTHVDDRIFWFSNSGNASLSYDGKRYSLGGGKAFMGGQIESFGIGLVEDAVFVDDIAIVWWHEYGLAAYRTDPATPRRALWDYRADDVISIGLSASGDAIWFTQWHRDQSPKVRLCSIRIADGLRDKEQWIDCNFDAQIIPRSDCLIELGFNGRYRRHDAKVS